MSDSFKKPYSIVLSIFDPLFKTVSTNFDLSTYGWPTKILHYAMFTLSLGGLGFAVFDLLAFSPAQFVVLGVSLIVAILINRHAVTTFEAEAKLSAAELIVFWGIIWLGSAGGVLLALSAAAAKFGAAGKDKKKWIFSFFNNIVAAFAAAQVFYLALDYFADFSGKAIADAELKIIQLLPAVALMTLTYYGLNSFILSIFLLTRNIHPIRRPWSKNLLWSAISYISATAATLLLYRVFIHFGIEFGLVFIPLAVFGNLAYEIYNRRLEQKTKEITEASRIHLATVEALATAIDARDQVGIGHVRRTQLYAIGIGKRMGLPETEINALRTGALLHDIGKLAVPDHILNKPDKLTAAEMEKIKIHAAVGASILEQVGFTDPVVPTVRYHHEHWDGSGYPEGLRGEQIPLTARILLVADAYDTMRGERPYRSAVEREEARRFIFNNAGTQFDPKIVDVFLRNLRYFEAEVEEQGFSYALDTADENLRPDSGADQNYVEQIKRANREVHTLYELARVFSTSLNLSETLSLFSRKISEFAPFATCAIYLLDETKKHAAIVYAEGKNSLALKDRRIEVGDGATGYVLREGRAVQNINPGLDFSFPELEFAQDYASMASLPLISDDEIIGAVSLYSYDLNDYGEDSLRLLETISHIAADAISKSLQHAATEVHALTDPMTGLPNARSLQMQFEKEAARAERTGSSFQVLMLDLDGFKTVNDTFGHKAGDKLLKGIAKVMRAQLREYDFLARYAGDEFIALITEADADTARELCERLEKAVADFILPVGEDEFARVGVSLGAASYPRSGQSFDQVITAADKAMYAAKSVRKKNRNGRGAESSNRSAQELPKDDLSKENLFNGAGEIDVRAITDENNFVIELDESHIISSAIN